MRVPKQLLMILFSVILFMSSTLNAGAETFTTDSNTNIEILTDEQINYLKSRGFTEDLIESFITSGDSFDKMKEMEVVSSNTKYYKVIEVLPNNSLLESFSENNLKFNKNINVVEKDVPTVEVEEISYEELSKALKEEENSDNGLIETFASNSTSTSYKRMTVTITKINTSRYRVSNEVVWYKPPTYTRNDVIGVGINGNTSPRPGTESGYQKVYSAVGHKLKQTINYSSSSSNWNRSGDYGLRVNLVDDLGLIAKQYVYTVYMQYEITPNVSNVTVLDAYGHYAHYEKNQTITPSFSINGPSLTLSSKSSYSIHSPQPHAQVRR